MTQTAKISSSAINRALLASAVPVSRPVIGPGAPEAGRAAR
jgi:hypothetical protein